MANVLRVLAGLMALSCALAKAAEPEDLSPRLAALIGAVSEQGLPTRLLEEKAAEGLAKGVPEDRIASVLSGLGSSLALARAALGEAAVGPESDRIIAAGALALRAGVSEAGLAGITAEPVATRVLALEGLGDLVRVGMPERDAQRLVHLAAVSSDPVTAFTGLAGTAAMLVRAGVSPGQAAEAIAAEVSHGRAANGAARALGSGNANAIANGAGNGNANGSGNGNANGSGGGTGNGNSGGNGDGARDDRRAP